MSESRSGEYQELGEQFRIAAPDVRAVETTFSNLSAAGGESPYQVALTNIGEITYNGGIAYETSDGEVHRTVLRLLQPGGGAIFPLAECANLRAYVIGVYIEGKLRGQYPPDGVITPDTIEDQDPCGDRIGLGIRSA
jgi:hypothetical protein